MSGCDWLRFGLLTGLGLLRSNCASGCDQPVFGSPDLESLNTSHIERVFLSVRQELKRFQRKGLGYSKDLATHKAAAALHFGVYNLVRRHRSLGATPAVAAGIEEKQLWGLEAESSRSQRNICGGKRMLNLRRRLRNVWYKVHRHNGKNENLSPKNGKNPILREL